MPRLARTLAAPAYSLHESVLAGSLCKITKLYVHAGSVCCWRFKLSASESGMTLLQHC